MSELPIRSEQHEIGEAAVREFVHQIPDRWADTKVGAGSDYGWDLILTIASAGTRQVKEEFYVQVKGSRSTEYGTDGSFASISLEVSTINFLWQRQMPVMIALCDVAKSDKPVYWVWLIEALKEVESRNPEWRNQETATLRIPTTQTVSRDIEKIESDVRRQYSENRAAKEIMDMLVPQKDLSTLPLPDSALIDKNYVTREILPIASISSTILDTVGSIGADSRRERLQSVSTLLRENRDAQAEKTLTLLEQDIEQSSSQIQATFHNCKGILALHRFQAKEAQECFNRAVQLNPLEPKHITNCLIAEYVVSGGYDGLPADWRARLSKAILEYPKFVPAARTQAMIIAHDAGLDAAEEFVRTNPAFAIEPNNLLIALAEACEEKGDTERALKLIREVESTGYSDAELLSTKATALMRKALSLTLPTDETYQLDGLGPSDLDIGVLMEAADIFDQACTAWTEAGLPIAGEITFANAASAFMMAQRFGDARRHCDAFLKRNPKSVVVSRSLAMILYHSGDLSEAIPHAYFVYETTKDSQSFKNLLLTLLKADEHEQLVDAVRGRQKSGFADQDEQALALHLTAIAFTELGLHSEADICVKQIKDNLSRPADALAVEVFLARRNGVASKDIERMIKGGLELYPGHLVLEADLVNVMQPITSENADELKRHIIKLADKRQLTKYEVAALGEAYFVLKEYPDAEQVFRAAAKRFPNATEFIVYQAYALHESGNDEEAFAVLSGLLSKGKHSFAEYRNLGHLARITGRLDEAIRLFELALGRTKDRSDRAELHCLLYELRKRRGDSEKEQLRHAVQYGKLCSADPESEARYLIMFFMGSLKLSGTDDEEVKSWISEFQERLKKFTDANPRFHSLMALKTPEGLSQREAAEWLITEMISLTLSTNLARSTMAIRMREDAWPLSTRAELLGVNSLCEYWQKCTETLDPDFAIHIHSAPLDLEAEARSVCLGAPVCVDITTLFTLSLLNLLDEVLEQFDYWTIAAGTREVLETDSIIINTPQLIAVQLRDWIIRNRMKIRTRKVTKQWRKGVRQDKYHLESGIYIPHESDVSELIGKGVGETLLLAQQLNLPLYSDEALIRIWSTEHYHVSSFSTIALLRRLRGELRLSLENETALIVKLINSNYRFIPFGPEHLQQGLDSLLSDHPNPASADMSNHPLLGPLLKEFGEPKLTDQSLIIVFAQWWLALAMRENISDLTRTEVVATVTFRLSQRVKEGVISGISVNTPLMRMAAIWATLLVGTHGRNK